MLLGNLGASLLGNMLTGKGMLRAGHGFKDLQTKEGKGILRAGYESKDFRFKKNFNSTPSLNKPWNTEISSDLMEFILEITCLKQ